MFECLQKAIDRGDVVYLNMVFLKADPVYDPYRWSSSSRRSSVGQRLEPQ